MMDGALAASHGAGADKGHADMVDAVIGRDKVGLVPEIPAASERSLQLHESMVSGFVGLADTLVLAVIAFVAYLALPGWSPDTLQMYAAAITVEVGLTVGVLHYAGLYDFNTIVAWPRRMRHMIALLALVALLLLAMSMALKLSEQFLPSWFFATVVAQAVGLFTCRGIAKLIIRRCARAGTLVRNVALVGAGGQAQHLVSRLKEHDAPWKRMIGIFDDRRTRISKDVDGMPVLGNLDDLVTYVRRGKIHDVIITLPWSADERLVSIVNKLRALPVHIYLGSDLIGYHFPRHQEQLLAGTPVLEIASAPLTGWSGLVKLIEDKVVAGGVLLMFMPLMILVALAIKINSRGPIFFKQKRYGFNNQLIEVLKFRSMYHEMRDENAVQQTQRNDPRVTRVGAFIRRTSLDELPQLINVLKGDMSIVGPRPHAIMSKAGGRLFEEVVAEYAARHKVKPGLTGWAQVNGWRGSAEEEWKIRARVEHDIYYIENWSLWFDLKILIMTIWIAVQGENAY